MEPTLKLSQEIAGQLDTFLKSEKGIGFIAEVKAADAKDVGTFEMIITTEDIDRVGEMIKSDAWELERYMLNPVVLWAHNYSELPVGMTEKLEKVEGGKLKATGKFAAHEKAQTIRELYDGGYIKTSSVGFIPLTMEGNIITKAELLEWSFVPVPCNPFALSTLGFSTEKVGDLVAKGLVVLEKQEKKEGDTCEIDGKEGVIDAEGNCVAKEEDKGIVPKAMEIVVDEKSITIVLESGEKVQHEATEKLLETLIEMREGRVLSSKNVKLIEECVGSLESTKSALEVLLSANVRSDDDDKAIAPEGKTGEQDDAFLKLREGLQGIASLAKEVLTEAKTEAHKRGIKTRRPN